MPTSWIQPNQNSLMDTFAQAEALKAQRAQNAFNEAKAAELPYAREREQALNTAKIGKVEAEARKAEADTLGSNLGNALKKVEIGSQILSGVRDEGSYQWARKRAAAEQLGTGDWPANFDPTWVQQTQQKGMQLKDQLAQQLNEQKFTEQQKQSGIDNRFQQASADNAQARLGQDAAQFQQREQRLGAQYATTSQTAANTVDTALRKEFTGLPAVKNYTTVVPIVQSLREAAGVDNAAADMNLVYGVAKIMDPESVVRESETAMVVSAGSPAEKYKGMFSYVVGGGRLTPETRTQLMNEVESRAKGHEGLYNDAVKQYQSGAPEIGSLPALGAGRDQGAQAPPSPNTTRTPVNMAPPGGEDERAELDRLRALKASGGR